MLQIEKRSSPNMRPPLMSRIAVDIDRQLQGSREEIIRRNRIVDAFNKFALPPDQYSQSRYDEHMGSVTRHYDLMKGILRNYGNTLLPERAKERRCVYFIELGYGTGELATYIVREVYLPFIRGGGSAVVVLVDPAQNMLEIAERKLRGLQMQAAMQNGDKLTVKLMRDFMESATIDKIDRMLDLGSYFDVALCSLVAPFLSNTKTAYTNVHRLLIEGGRMVTMEENPALVVTPSASLPDDFERTLIECARPTEPKKLHRSFTRIGFTKLRGSSIVMPVGDTHEIHGVVHAK